MPATVAPIPALDVAHDAPSEHNRDSLLAGAIALIGFLISVIFAASSPDGIVQFDDLTHYLYAKWAWIWPSYLLDEWGRPGFTVLYFLPARAGWFACRVLSAALSGGAAYLAYCIARQNGLRSPWAAALLTFIQPLFFQLSQTTLTETPLAFYLTLGIYLAGRGAWGWSAVVFSLTLITRHECLILLPVWGYFAWRARVPWAKWSLLLWAPVLTNLLAIPLDMRPAISRWLAPSPSQQYGRGGWLTFFCRSLEAFGPGIAVLALVGLRSLWSRQTARLIVSSIIVFFAAQTAVRALGLYDSGGYARFLVPLCPLIAIAALAGWDELISPDPRRRNHAVWLALASMLLFWFSVERQLVLHARHVDEAAHLPELHNATQAVRISTAIFFVVCVVYFLFARFRALDVIRSRMVPTSIVALCGLALFGLCGPLRAPREGKFIDDARRRLAQLGLADREIISAMVWLDYITNRKLPPDRFSVRKQINVAPVGTIFAWERQFAGCADHKIALEDLQKSPNFRPLFHTDPLPWTGEPYLWFFEKTRDGPL